MQTNKVKINFKTKFIHLITLNYITYYYIILYFIIYYEKEDYARIYTTNISIT